MKTLLATLAILAGLFAGACGGAETPFSPTPPVIPPPPPIVTDLCSNLDGVQETVPNG